MTRGRESRDRAVPASRSTSCQTAAARARSPRRTSPQPSAASTSARSSGSSSWVSIAAARSASSAARCRRPRRMNPLAASASTGAARRRSQPFDAVGLVEKQGGGRGDVGGPPHDQPSSACDERAKHGLARGVGGSSEQVERPSGLPGGHGRLSGRAGAARSLLAVRTSAPPPAPERSPPRRSHAAPRRHRRPAPARRRPARPCRRWRPPGARPAPPPTTPRPAPGGPLAAHRSSLLARSRCASADARRRTRPSRTRTRPWTSASSSAAMSAGHRRRRRGEHVHVALTLGGHEQQELPSRGTQRRHPAGDDLPHPRAGRQRQVQRLPARPLIGGQRRGQLHERERDARRRIDDDRGDRSNHIRGDPVEHGPRRVRRQRPDPHGRQSGTPSVVARDHARRGRTSPVPRLGGPRTGCTRARRRRATERRRRRPGPAGRGPRSAAGRPSPRTPPTGRPATAARARAPPQAHPPAAAEAPRGRRAQARAGRTGRRTPGRLRSAHPTPAGR